MQIRIPYGRTEVLWDVDPARVLVPKMDELKSDRNGREIVEEALRHPIGSPSLRELAAGKKTCTLIISDHTRPVPSKDILPPMLRELRAGNPEIDITLLVATGFHRGTTAQELQEKLGPEIYGQVKILVHDSQAPETNEEIGVLPSGAPLVIDKAAVHTDLLISEGFIEPHFFAGFSGGRKSVLPGVCDRKTVLGNHCGGFIGDDHARTGNLLDNPIHRDMVRAAELARLAFIVNVVIDEEKKTVAAFAGDFRKAHEAGVAFLRPYAEVPAVPGDIVVTGNGGAPLDQNIYQCVKCMTAAEASARPGAVLVILAEAKDGTGGEGFYRTLRDCTSPKEQYEAFCRTPQSETVPDQWESQILCRILSEHRVIFVTRPELRQTVTDMKMEYAKDLAEALRMAGSGEITWIPNGISLIVRK